MASALTTVVVNLHTYTVPVRKNLFSSSFCACWRYSGVMIEFEHVTKSYPDQTVAVADFSLAIDSHRTIALVGSSGSGKTTLLRMVNRMVEPTAGRVLIDG